MDGCEAASRLIRDGMGAIGETGDGAPGLGKELIQLAERPFPPSGARHRLPAECFPHALQHFTSPGSGKEIT